MQEVFRFSGEEELSAYHTPSLYCYTPLLHSLHCLYLPTCLPFHRKGMEKKKTYWKEGKEEGGGGRKAEGALLRGQTKAGRKSCWEVHGISLPSANADVAFTPPRHAHASALRGTFHGEMGVARSRVAAASRRDQIRRGAGEPATIHAPLAHRLVLFAATRRTFSPRFSCGAARANVFRVRDGDPYGHQNLL